MYAAGPDKLGVAGILGDTGFREWSNFLVKTTDLLLLCIHRNSSVMLQMVTYRFPGADSTPVHEILYEPTNFVAYPRDEHDKFEHVVRRYFEVTAKYRDLFDSVWLWNDWPERKGRADSGIDLVARERGSGEYFAIQGKFYDQDHTLQKSDVDSFYRIW